MPKVAGKVIKTKIEDKAMLAIIKFNGKLPPVDAKVTIKWGRTRSNLQNNFYWLYLTFLFEDCGLKDEYLTIEELHETFKATFLSKSVFCDNGFEFVKVGSTTTLDKLSFGEYLDKIDKAMTEYKNIDTSKFFEEYERFWKPQ